MPNGVILLSQSKYIKDLLTRANIFNVKGLPTPMVSNNKLTKYGGNYMAEPSFYWSVVGASQHATITRLEICFSVN